MLIVGVSVGLRHEPGCYGVMEVEKGEGLGLGHHGNQGQGQGQGQEGPTAKKGKDKGNKGMGNDRGKRQGHGQGYVGFNMLLHPPKKVQGQVQR